MIIAVELVVKIIRILPEIIKIIPTVRQYLQLMIVNHKKL